ncbi:LPXTG cell wall anchor domain-containing protein [Actinoplanes sp. NPDC051343]|uniref:LPXTG cell wall anchor domain-containing protein n=1 Tax=Actinoplanes sp. NPDC051343 TaxID=3363906 RepID=UPI0037AFA217
MKFKSPLHRTATVLAGAVIGLTGVVAIAGPASAHNATVKGVASCQDGKSLVTWELRNDWPGDATISDLQLPKGDAPQPVEDGIPALANGSVITKSKGYSQDDATVVHYTQVVDQADSVTLSFTATWADGTVDSSSKSDDNTATVPLTHGCTPPPAKCVDSDHLDQLGLEGRLTHTFQVDKDSATTVVDLHDVKLCDDVQIPVTSVSYYAPKPEFSVPQYLFDQPKSGVLTQTNREVTLTVKTPPCFTQVDTFFGTEKDVIPTITKNGPLYGDRKLGSDTGIGSRSKGPHAWYNGGDRSCVTPAGTSVPSCDGTQMINLSNSGKYDETFTVKYGDQVKTVTVAGGKGESVNVPAGAGAVTVSAEGMDTKTFTWKAPADCATPAVSIANTCKEVTITVTNPKGVTPAVAKVTYGKQTKELTVAPGSSEKATFAAGTAKVATVDVNGLKTIKAALKSLVCTVPVGNNSGGGSLPITGTAGTSIAAGAIVLLLAGSAFFFVARRRKVRFTA